MRNFSIIPFVIGLMTTQAGFADQYYQRELKCTLSASQQDLDHSEKTFPQSIDISMKASFIVGKDKYPAKWSYDVSGLMKLSDEEKQTILSIVRPTELTHTKPYRLYHGGNSEDSSCAEGRYDHYSLAFAKMDNEQVVALAKIMDQNNNSASITRAIQLSNKTLTIDAASFDGGARQHETSSSSLGFCTSKRPKQHDTITSQFHADYKTNPDLNGLSLHFYLNCGEPAAQSFDEWGVVSFLEKEPKGASSEKIAQDYDAKELNADEPPSAVPSPKRNGEAGEIEAL